MDRGDKTTHRVRGVIPGLVQTAQGMRRNMTPAETALWEELRGKRLRGLRFRSQHPVGRVILDFYCPSIRLAVEVDGGVHVARTEQDEGRTLHLSRYGITVLRFTNGEVLNEMPSVLARIARAAENAGHTLTPPAPNSGGAGPGSPQNWGLGGHPVPPELGAGGAVRVAAVQMDVRLAEVTYNLSAVLERLDTAAKNGARLIVFPECALTGYGFADANTAHMAACAAKEALDALRERCHERNVTAIVGTLLPGDGTVRNAAVTIRPDGIADVYHKTHLPYLGVDKIVERGNRLEVVDTPVGKVGTIICYDLRFPEAARTLALKGAEIIALPTNWPEGSEASGDFISRSRAAENRVFLVVANRVGTESGFTFVGRSQVCDIEGNRIAEASRDNEEIIYADIEPVRARQKRMVVVPGEYEMDFIGDRCPEAYRAD